MKGNYQIQKATEGEIVPVTQLLKEVAAWLKIKEVNQWGFLLAGGEDEEIRQAILDGATYAVWLDGELIATFTLYATQSEWDQHIWGSEDHEDVLYLHRLAIRPAYMGKGIGQELLEWIEVNLDKTIRLDCVSNHPKLRTFYTENGFEEVGINDGHCKMQK
ncbi:GNAT family N-acetyltransferase [Sporosarcina sp. ITBMC105]